MTTASTTGPEALDPRKFRDPDVTADGERRARVEFDRLETLWFNTGSLCNIECRRCYMGSGPADRRLDFLGAAEVEGCLEEVAELGLETREIGFTGGEPFVNPELCRMVGAALGRGFDVLVLTNAMRPMMRPGVRRELARLNRRHPGRLHLRVSLDHHTPERHDRERGAGAWEVALSGLRWLAAEELGLSVAGRGYPGEPESVARSGYARLFADEGLPIDARDPAALVIFPEMDAGLDVPEITEACWDVLGTGPAAMMCARSRMVVKRRGSGRPVVVSCTLLPYDRRFEMGCTLAASLGVVRLSHPHCARFCVLGGASCSPAS